MKVSVIQMVSVADTDKNLAHASTLLRKAKEQGATLVILPEMFAHFGEKDAAVFARLWCYPNGPIRSWLSAISNELDLWIVAGTIPVLDGDHQEKPTATSFLYNNEGDEFARYDKIHLFDVDIEDQQQAYRESNFYQAGSRSCVTETPVGSLGLSVCYDLRFPELYRNLSKRGSQIIAIPSAFTYQTGKSHWLPLLQARAIENQCYILAANQGGIHSDKRRTWGHSCVIDPWGKVLGLLEEGEGVISCKIDLDEVSSIRKSIPCLNHRQEWL